MIDVVDDGGSVRIVYTDSNQNTSSVTVVGSSVSEVEKNAEELATKHNLQSKAQQQE
jgi:hypothetical protein